MSKATYSIHIEQPPLARLARPGHALTGTRLLLPGIAIVAALTGVLVAIAGLNALYLAFALIGCAFILLDFRIGVVLLIVLLPISRSAVFPHAMMGITGLNPLNLLLVGTLGSYFLQALTDGSLRRFLPPPLFWLYLVPLVIAGVLGSRQVDQIAPAFTTEEVMLFDTAATYTREMVLKPLMLVVFALLVAAAVAKSRQPEHFLGPTMISIWVMGGMVVVYFVLSGVALGDLAGSDSRGFLSGLGMHANELGRLYAVAYALLLYTWSECRGTALKTALLASMAMVVIALLLTFSRSAFIGLVLVSALFLVERLSARTVIFAVVVAALALAAVPGAVYERATAGLGDGLNAITAGRLEGLWLPLLPEVLRNPIIGSGHGSILWSDTMRVGGDHVIAAMHPHSAYLQAVMDMGIVGLVLVGAYFVHVWRGFRRLSRDGELSPALRGFFRGAAAGLLCFLLVGVVDSSLMPKPEQAFLWLAIGMMYGFGARKAAAIPPH
ncbi:MAG TPA: O-antigen ligase family protein [Burkholderiales bacterium]|nr:O-antigen ligase family protein [Burkholderiales bacterium]